MSTALLEMSGISKSFAGVRVLSAASLSVREAEVHVLVGENGAGKSTLMKVLCGQLPADEGTIRLAGRRIDPRSPQQAASLGLAMIHQELTLVEGLSVAANLFLGREPRRFSLIDDRQMRAQATKLLARLGVTIDPTRLAGTLSVAEQQLVEIAKALGLRPRVLVLDEPTAALSAAEIRRLFATIGGLCADGVAAIFISHRMDEVFTIGSRATVMRDGQTVATHNLSDVSVDQLIRMMVGRPLAEQIPKRPVTIGTEALRLDAARSVGLRAGVSLALHRGEVLGLAGLMASGRTEVCRAIFGADPLVEGAIVVAGRRIANSPQAAIAAGVGYVTEDRKRLGLVLHRSVSENVTLARLRRLTRRGLIRREQEAALVAELTRRLKLKAASPRQPVLRLSGGNQQKVVIAKWLATESTVLLLDEPTRGIDVAAKLEVYTLIGDLVAEGAAVLLVSSDLPELLGLADRIAVMHEGKLSGILQRQEATQERILKLALGNAD